MGVIYYNDEVMAGAGSNANTIGYNHTSSGLYATNVQTALDEINNHVKDISYYTDPVSCLTGDTTCTILDNNIYIGSVIYPIAENSSGMITGVKKIEITNGQAIITFSKALTEATNIILQIVNTLIV